MFRRIAGIIEEGANGLFLQHPSVLTTLLEVAWQGRLHSGEVASVGHPNRRSNLPQLPDYWLNALSKAAGIFPPGVSGQTGQKTIRDLASLIITQFWGPGEVKNTPLVLWDHLIYAYMIENTRIYEIFRRVLHEFAYGEKLGVPTRAAQHWLRNTEEMFYRDPPPFSILNIVSHIRPDLRATRRNAYWRMFGMDLNHGTDDGQPYAYAKTEAANNEFVNTFEEFLRECWVAISNVNNKSGANPTDRGKLADLVKTLRDMLMTRRESGNLSREEFSAVSTMSWFHLTVSYDSPIVQTLRAEAASPEQRLYKIAQRVGLPAHGLSKSYFEIAEPLSLLLVLIEASESTDTIDMDIVPGLLEAGPLQSLLATIITHWSIITGRDIKAGKVAVR